MGGHGESKGKILSLQEKLQIFTPQSYYLRLSVKKKKNKTKQN